MLQQILQDMWVEPAILAELDDDQKQTLFCKMREEQVRRWRLWDQKLADHPPPPPRPRKNNAKTVQFLNGSDGEPWVWVMGEHPDDVPIEQILEREARDKARKQAELEAQQLRLSELTELLDLSHKQIQEMEAESITQLPQAQPSPPPPVPLQLPLPPPRPQHLQLLQPLAAQPAVPPRALPAAPPPPEDDPAEMIYCSVDELREWSRKKEEPSAGTLANNALNSLKSGGRAAGRGREPRDVLHEISLNSKPVPKVAQRVAQWERRVLETRTEQILCNLKRRQQEAAREAEELAPAQERLWQEQERRAKEAELQIREIARRAREEHRRTSVLDDSRAEAPASPASPASPRPPAGAPPSGPPPPPPPQSREAVVQWYRRQEEPRRAGLDAAGAPQPWFHGLISRQEAEARLAAKGPGTFLVRLSERVWGYAISYRDGGGAPGVPSAPGADARRCKHYLVDTTGPGGGYQFLGANQICHKSLEDLVRYHRENPITLLGGERLLEPCRRPMTPPTSPGALAPSSAPAPAVSLPLPHPPLPARPLPPLPVSTHYRPVYAGGARNGRGGPE